MLSSVKASLDDKIDVDDCKNVVVVLMGHSASVCTYNFANESCLSVLESFNRGAKDREEEPSGLTPTIDIMGCAIAAGRWDEVNRLVDNKNFHIDYLSTCSGYLTALAAASKKPSGECRNVRELLRRGASPITPCGEDGAEHAFNVAASHGQDDVLVLLRNSGWGLNGGELDESQTIVQGGVSPLAKAVIGASGYDPEFNFDEKVTKRLTEHKRGKCIQCVKYLLEWGSNPLNYDDKGDTPFIHAVRGGDGKVVECFVNFSKDPGVAASSPYSSLFSLDAPHEKGRTALMESAKMGRNDICNLLLGGGASLECVDVEGRNVLQYATLAGETSTLGSLLKKSSLDQIRAVDR
jgi:ankyrin repeat protein